MYESHMYGKKALGRLSYYSFRGPAMPIGLGGGAASSIASGTQAAELDFTSVQRANPEMQRAAKK